MQMFFISPVMFLPLWWLLKANRKGWFWAYASLYLVSATVIPLVMTIIRDWPANSAVAAKLEYICSTTVPHVYYPCFIVA